MIKELHTYTSSDTIIKALKSICPIKVFSVANRQVLSVELFLLLTFFTQPKVYVRASIYQKLYILVKRKLVAKIYRNL